MDEHILAAVVAAPLQFLNWGWWIVHVVGIGVIFLLGHAAGKKCVAGKAAG
jgi:hypothetical protein